MRFEDIVSAVSGIPFMEPLRAKRLYDFILREKPEACLELGTLHGVSSCYIAGALQEVGHGKLITVDLLHTANLNPPIEALLERTGLSGFVEIKREVHSYTWFLKKEVAHQTRDGHCVPAYDFCFIDGAKDWTVDGCAFFLVDKLLKEGSWILFDDYDWTVQATGALAKWAKAREAQLSADEAEEPPIRNIFELLVMQSPSYSEFLIEDEMWAWAHKVRATPRVCRVEIISPVHVLAYRAAVSMGKRLVRRLSG